MVTKWISNFQANNKEPDEDIAFDVLCGDFNFDNCSPSKPLPPTYFSYIIICNISIFTESFHKNL